MNPSRKESLFGVFGAIVGVGILTPAFRIFGIATETGDTTVLYSSLTIIGSVFLCGLILFWNALPFGKPLTKSPYRAQLPDER